jgi:hypothetical protein
LNALLSVIELGELFCQYLFTENTAHSTLLAKSLGTITKELKYYTLNKSIGERRDHISKITLSEKAKTQNRNPKSEKKIAN